MSNVFYCFQTSRSFFQKQQLLVYIKKMCILPLFFTKAVYSFFYSEVSIPWTTQSALHFTPWQTCSFRHQLSTSQGRIQSRCNYCASRPTIRHGDTEHAQVSKQQQRGFETRLSRRFSRKRHSLLFRLRYLHVYVISLLLP